MSLERVRVWAGGAVQGVGFRPFVFRLATELGLRGFVRNDSGGLVIEAEGEPEQLRCFLRRLRGERPAAAVVLTEETAWLAPRGYGAFVIAASEDRAEKTAAVLPDLATCPACLAEVLNPGERRHAYPFTNCTQCGPRYTIVRAIPYDRRNTTLAQFPLCAECEREYRDPADRRFHAQPMACPKCGPRLEVSLEEAAEALAAGRIVALKGVGGYQLLCDARRSEAVRRLRRRKRREAKPFAVMLPSLTAARALCELSEEEERLLTSTAAPIVLLAPRLPLLLAPEVSECSPYLGVMLPYSPLHHLLLRAFPHPVVATSGNRSDEPICTGKEEAVARLAGIADLFVSHNRPIARPCDDSVARVVRGRPALLRRARGYAPLPVWIGGKLPKVLAAGAHLKNTIALAIGSQVVVSQHIGDLDTLEARRCFEETISDLCRLYSFTPDVIACDLHPDYFGTQWAEAQNKPLVRVQHHVAHALSCAAENGVAGRFLGAGWDGTGYGTDGTIWGSEVFVFEETRIVRVAHLPAFPLPGGEAAMRQTWRCAAALRHAVGLPADPRVAPLLQKHAHAPLTTSLGRLFDGLASLLGFAEENRFEGEAGLRLEAAARAQEPLASGVPPNFDWREWIASPLSPYAFHHWLAASLAAIARQHEVTQVCLSGGCFQNALLTELCCAALEQAGIRAYVHQRVPANDGGLSLGQVRYVAAGSSTADMGPFERGSRQSAP